MKALTFIFLFLAFTVKGQIIYVHPDSLHSTVQSGINAATDGDTVLVADGIYHEQISFLGKAITVASNYIMDGDPTHIDNTVLDGDLLPIGNSSVVLFTSGEDTTSMINGFTIRNGQGTYHTYDIYDYILGGGINIVNSGAKILNNRITHNILDGSIDSLCTLGAAICAFFPSTHNWIVAINNTIDSNQCKSTYLDAGGAALFTSYDTRLIDNTFEHNESICIDNAYAYGNISSISFPDTNVWFIAQNNTIQYNLTEGYGGSRSAGIFSSKCYNIITNNIISNNETSAGNQTNSRGAGIYLDYPLFASVKSNDFHGNTSSGYSGGCGLGGYINKEINIEDNTFTMNEAMKGGAIASSINGIIKSNWFEDNSSTQEGGAIYLSGSTDNLTTIENNTFIGNQSPRGGGFYGSNSETMLINNVFHQNNATSMHGGAVYLYNAGSPETITRFINNSFSENTSLQLGGAIFSWGCNPIILNSVFWEDSGSTGNEICAMYGNASVAYSNIDPEGIDGEVNLLDGNMFHDPLFCSTYCLMPDSTSPCLNVGTEQYVFPGQDTLNAPLQDILGRTRPINDSYDMGAYEVDTVYVGISKLESQLQFKLYPNPFSHRLYCTYNLPEQAKVEVIIYDMVGRIMTTLQERQLSGFYNIPVKTDKLTKGIYLFVLKIDGMAVSRKIIKQ